MRKYSIAFKVRGHFTNKLQRGLQLEDMATRETPFPIYKDEDDTPSL